jgi:hypothetical protein
MLVRGGEMIVEVGDELFIGGGVMLRGVGVLVIELRQVLACSSLCILVWIFGGMWMILFSVRYLRIAFLM